MLQIEKEHKRLTLMNRKKKDLVDQIMCLEHNNNVLHDMLNQQAENFKKICEDCKNKENKTKICDICNKEITEKEFKNNDGYCYKCFIKMHKE